MAAPILEKMVPLLVILLLLHVVSCKDKPVSVALNAKWSSTPYLLEASEFIANEGNDNFWMFLGMVTRDPPSAYHIESDRGHYELILRYASKVLSPLQMTLLKLSLSLRMYSPAVENYQRLANSEIPPADCSAFMNIHGKISCDLTQLDGILSEIESRPKVPVFKFDHTYPGSSGSPVQVILYAELGEESFVRFHQVLSRLAESKKIHYVFRHRFTATEEQTRLSGYGVELALKSTEYKAKDDTKVDGGSGKEDEDEGDDEVQGFVFSKLRELHPEMTSDLKAFKQHLIASSTELAALKVWELQDLSLQAAQKVLNAGTEEALPVLTDLSQNFPSRTRSLVKIQVDENLKKEVKKNQDKFDSELNIAAGDSAIFLNGIPIDMELYDVFNLLDVMKSEANIMEGLYSLGFQAKDVSEFLKLDMKGKSKFALDIRHSAVQYLNDLENDARYRNWPSSVQDFLRPTFPGMLRHVAKNIFHLVFIVDPLDKDGEDLIKMAEAFVVHNAPIRVGFVLKVNFDLAKTGEDDIGIAVSRAFDYLYKEESPIKAISFVTDIYERKKKSEITAKSVIADFMRINKDADKDLVFGSSDEYDTSRRGAMDFISRSGLKDFPQVLLNGVPLDKKYLNSESFEEGVVSTILSQTPSIQQHIYQGTLHDFVNILEYLMEEDNVLPRLNSRVLYNEEKNLDLTANIDPEIYKAPEMFSLMNSKDMASIMANNMLYMTRKDDDMLRSMTMWIVCDLETPEGRELLYASLKHLKHTHAMRVGVIFSTPSDDAKDNLFITRAVYTALTTLPSGQAKNFITKLAKEENVADLKAKKKTLKDLEVNGMDTEAYLAAFEAMDTKFLQVHHTFVEKVLAWPTSARGVVANGQIIGPLDDGEEFLEEDFSLLEKFKFNKGGSSLKNHLASLGKKDSGGTDLLMKVASLLSSSDSNQERKKVSFQSDKYSVVKLPADPSSPAYQMEVILDPASRDAQRISPILMVLKESVNIEIKIFMNCRDKLSEMPVKTYYRYVMEPEVSFNDDNTFSAGPRAKFTGLPQKSILTLGMHAPESWLVGVVKAAYDLDNILLEEVSNAIHADFALDYILLEGHCSDSTSGQPPRGLQFTLGVNSSDALQDTIVMANLGYFQLKANPGLWYLKLREGRSLELYDIQSHENTDTPKDMDDVVVVINSFQSKIIRVKVAKKPDKFHEQLLHDDQEDKSLWQSISSTITGEKKEEEKEVTLNIFSLASGHMYERLMRIMMLSVLKNTKSKVKFWFLKNYLSPSFKDFIPKMAKEYSFEFELVEYKWPRWLHQQKEKQRIMWGYKILFLDVLFPLDVKKIIFVDADQIVRTDLKELHDLDLGGAPYGYTPFCDSRREMEGFRFWKHGYWASHLAGRKYHISALYVVDLKKFRQVAAGDRLRGQYQGLSQDPNSLSNLDQDLPNNMIHQVPIKSLPQEWLWCETWCDDVSKNTAKTIDLCNNPQTKEPKLKAALRIVPEWKEYDYEVKVLWDKVYKTNTREQIEYEPPNIETETIGARIKDEL